MDLELIGSYFMILLMPIASITGIIICIWILKKTANAEMVRATIVSFRHNGYREKYLTYEVRINNKIIRLSRLVKLKSGSNSLATQYLGREVMVPYDSKHNKLYPHKPIVLGYLTIFAMLTLMGFGILVMLILL